MIQIVHVFTGIRRQAMLPTVFFFVVCLDVNASHAASLWSLKQAQQNSKSYHKMS